MRAYHKPEIELKELNMADVLNLSGESPFNDDWFSTQTGGGE